MMYLYRELRELHLQKFTLIVSKTTDKCREKYYSSASKKCEKSPIQPNDLQSYDKSTQYAVITHLKFSPIPDFG